MKGRKTTTKEWIEKVEAKFPGKYTFEKTKYSINSNPIIITCKIHGDLYFKAAQRVLNKQTEPCRYCAGYLPDFEETQEWLQKWMKYDESSGEFYIRANGERKGYRGMQGYLSISFSGREFLVHRLIFLYMEGKIPKSVDHIDQDRTNNSWKNLRKASLILQNLNKDSDGVEETTGGNYVARIVYKGKTYRSRKYIIYQEAKDKYEEWKHKLIQKELKDNDIV